MKILKRISNWWKRTPIKSRGSRQTRNGEGSSQHIDREGVNESGVPLTLAHLQREGARTPALLTDQSTVVNDRGETQYRLRKEMDADAEYQHILVRSNHPAHAGGDPHVLGGIGARFQDHRGTQERRPIELSQPAQDHIEKVNKELFDAAHQKGYQWEKDRWYIPNGEIERILDLPTVMELLPACINTDGWATTDFDAKLTELASKICGLYISDDGSPTSSPISYRKTLAVLILANKHTQLKEFMGCGVKDSTLPLINQPSDDPVCNYRLCFKNDLHGTSPECFEGWTDDQLNTFYERQWWLSAPFFKGEANHYKLNNRLPLPFRKLPVNISKGNDIEPNDGNHGGDVTLVEIKVGGGGHVTPIEIQKDHCDPASLPPPMNGGPRCALKKLRDGATQDEFNREVEILRRLSRRTDRKTHLVELLFTMELQDPLQFYLVFPLATGDLNCLWKKVHPLKSNKPQEMTRLAHWVAEQCYGVADALSQVHDMREEQENPTDQSANLSHTKICNYGIHADIKPGNLLWFGIGEDTYGGTIQLADFGISSIHHTESRSDAKLGGHTKTYRSPEMELPQTVSRSVDIWALGCVFLEFISWMVLGKSSGLDNFAEKRSKCSINLERFHQDTFYSLDEDGPTRTKAIVNPAVVSRVEELRRHRKCTQFVHDLLDLITTGMLVVEDRPIRASFREQDTTKRTSPTNAADVGPATSNSTITQVHSTTTDKSGKKILQERLKCLDVASKLKEILAKGATEQDTYYSQPKPRGYLYTEQPPPGITIERPMKSLRHMSHVRQQSGGSL